MYAPQRGGNAVRLRLEFESGTVGQRWRMTGRPRLSSGEVDSWPERAGAGRQAGAEWAGAKIQLPPLILPPPSFVSLSIALPQGLDHGHSSTSSRTRLSHPLSLAYPTASCPLALAQPSRHHGYSTSLRVVAHSRLLVSLP